MRVLLEVLREVDVRRQQHTAGKKQGQQGVTTYTDTALIRLCCKICRLYYSPQPTMLSHSLLELPHTAANHSQTLTRSPP